MRVSFASIDGVRTRYLHAGRAGTGHPLFLLHGVGLSGDVFVRNLDALGEEFAVYAPPERFNDLVRRFLREAAPKAAPARN